MTGILARGWLLTIGVAFSVLVAYALLAWVYDTPTEPVQIIWTCLGIAGVIVTSANLIDSWIDLSILQQNRRNGELRLIARAAIRQDAIRLVQMLIVIGIGIASLSAAPTLTQEQRDQLHIPTWTPLLLTITSGIGLITALTVVQAVLDRRARLMFYAKQGVPRHDRREHARPQGGPP